MKFTNVKKLYKKLLNGHTYENNKGNLVYYDNESHMFEIVSKDGEALTLNANKYSSLIDEFINTIVVRVELKKIDDVIKVVQHHSIEDIDELINRQHAMHYFKWDITDDLSIRYYMQFEDKPTWEHKFIIKSHQTKTYQIILDESLAKQMIENLAINDAVEIIGYSRNKGYEKLTRLANSYTQLKSHIE